MLEGNGYQGRRWDAPMTDDLPVIDLVGTVCAMCREPITADDDAIVQGSIFHIECLIRSSLGDVAHLEGRCRCVGGNEHDEVGTYREQSQRALDWVVEHKRGRWAT